MEDQLRKTAAGDPAAPADNGDGKSAAMRRMEERSLHPDQASLSSKEISVSADEFERMKLGQRMPMAIVAGLVAGAACAMLWAMITVALQIQIGYMALAVGAGVGFAVRLAGKGVTPAFGVVGAVISLLSCLAGNFFGVMGAIASFEGVPVMELIAHFDYSYLPSLMGETFHVRDLLFYAIAMYEGFRFGFKRVSVKPGVNPALG